MKKIGLALSGGGFRASLYHLGLVRFLRDAGILPQVTHITSVSGGSIVAAHLVLNWERYNGSPSDFDAVAQQVLDFVRVDVRNRIARRFPLSFVVRWPRRLLRRSNRKLTRTGLLEYHYEKYLYGDTSLFQLPERPQLHILATNVTEGCLCSFNRDGLLMRRRHEGRTFRLDRLHAGLATVAMAVTASSAFPGFFPPLVLTGQDVGARGGEFGRQAFTDGGIFDNLGVRMFQGLVRDEGDQCGLDGVLVSDVGKRISMQTGQGSGGLIRTAMRASDILMDRVWQLESETFEDECGFIFARMNDIVDPYQDATALHPEIQRQTANIRTDLDRFSPLEISSLIRHGYCVARKMCRAHPELFGADLPTNAPWDPMPDARFPESAVAAVASAQETCPEPSAVTLEARTLQRSAARRIWSTLLDYRDWMSYVYVPILVPILFMLPYVVVKTYQRSHRISQLVDSLAQGSRDMQVMSRLLEGPMKPWTGEAADEVYGLDEPDFSGFDILQDSRIIDMRAWNPAAPGKNEPDSLVFGYRRLKVLKRPDCTGNNLFRIGVLATHPQTQLRFPPQDLLPRLRMTSVDSMGPSEKRVRWEVSVDCSKVPAGEMIDLTYEHISPGEFLQRAEGSTSIMFPTPTDMAEVTRWFLLPRGKEYRSFRILRWETGKPESVEPVKIVNEYLADDSTILAYKLISVKGGYTYQITWYYK